MSHDHQNTSDFDPEESRLDALLAGHALGDLDEQERSDLQAALEAVPTLPARLEEFRTTLQLLPLALPRGKAPPARLRQRLLSEAEPSGCCRARSLPGRPQVPWLLACGFSVALVAVGGDWLSLRGRLARPGCSRLTA